MKSSKLSQSRLQNSEILNRKHIASVTVLVEAMFQPQAYYTVIVGVFFLIYIFFTLSLFIAFICGNLSFLTWAQMKQVQTLIFQLLAF